MNKLLNDIIKEEMREASNVTKLTSNFHVHSTRAQKQNLTRYAITFISRNLRFETLLLLMVMPL